MSETDRRLRMSSGRKSKKSEERKYCVIVNALVVKGDKILICKRSTKEKHVPGRWSPVGGKLEENGTVWSALEETARREVREEAGVEIQERLDFLLNNTFCHEEDNLPVVSVVFVCYFKSGKAKPLEDTTEVKWLSAAEVGNYEFTHDNVKNYILKGFQFLEFGKKETGQRSV